jgi:hypothetical protein
MPLGVKDSTRADSLEEWIKAGRRREEEDNVADFFIEKWV